MKSAIALCPRCGTHVFLRPVTYVIVSHGVCIASGLSIDEARARWPLAGAGGSS